MIKTAVVISGHSKEGTVGLYDKVTFYVEDDDEEITCQIVTTHIIAVAVVDLHRHLITHPAAQDCFADWGLLAVLITDYIAVAGIGGAFVNAGLVTIVSTSCSCR